jgi:hypothetical protein
LVFPWGCAGSENVDLEITVQIDGDVVTISWEDPRAVHEVVVYPTTGPTSGNTVWRVTAGGDDILRPNTTPTVTPPLEYGQEVEGAFIIGPDALVQGIRYRVLVAQKAWGESCREAGIPVATDDTSCSLADGFTEFTF